MSILPSHTHSLAQSSSSLPSPNPNFNGLSINGDNPHHHPRPQLSSPSIHGSDCSAMDSVRISGSEPFYKPADSVSGSVVEGDSYVGGSSEKVMEHGSSNGMKSSHQSNINGDKSHAFAQGGAGSSQSSGDIVGSPPTRRPSGSSGKRSQTVNGNHLLNFQYNPISRPRSQPRGPASKRPQKIKPYNKDLFLQANYKFVVLDSGNYTVESMDPDKMLQWEDIICVKYSTPHPVQCPICLDSLLCPQITSCGHIFCFPCILQYLLMGEGNHKAECWRKCPLCFMMISSKDLYTIYIENVKEYNVGDTIEFAFLTRKKDSFSLHERKGGMSCKLYETFSKFILTSDVELSVRQAISDLDNWLARADSGLVDDMEKFPYVSAAMDMLKERKKFWNAHRNSEGKRSCNENHAAYEPGTLAAGIGDPYKGTEEEMADSVQAGVCFVQSSDTDESLEGQDGASSSSYDDNKTLQFQADTSRDAKERDSYHFYQVVDGQHIILHPLNVKCLLQHYGSYELLPARVTGRILQLESVTQSEAVRKRYRYLSHFPLTTTFQLCEIDLREILPPEALSPFLDEIKKREKQRKWTAKKECEDKMKADALDAYSFPVPYNSVRFNDGPAFSMDDFEALGSSSPGPAVSSPPVHGERLLFSSVARLGFAAAHDSPSLNIQESSPLPHADRTAASAAFTGSRNQGTSSFANVISRERSVESVGTNKPNEAGGKKGKKHSRVLLSTAGGRRY